MLLQLTGISKYFPGVKALENIQFDLQKGEVHAICGENGAGKSTLMNILTGNLQPDAGKIVLLSKEVKISNPTQATQLGIAIVYQQLSLVDTLSVAENIFANSQPRNRWGFIQHSKLYEKTNELLNRLGITDIQARTLLMDLSPGQQQMIEIAKALSKEPSILILDEPTASITERETQVLFSIIRQLKKEGKSVIYISHRMQEIFQIADRVTVLKDGYYQGTHSTSQVIEKDLIRMMVGRDIVAQESQSFATNQLMLEVRNLSGKRFRNISFKLHKGEILGLSGLVGAGRTEIAQTIFGYLPKLSGEILIGGELVSLNHPGEAIDAGIGYVPEERKSQGLFLDKTIVDNILAAKLPAAVQGSWYNPDTAFDLANTYKDKLRIATPDVYQLALFLSGGNQQKVVLAKWLLANPDILIVDEPTHGIDVGAKAEIYELLRALAAQGKALLFISSELPEVLALADRILVVREGIISGELAGKRATEEEVMALAAI
jgi:ribose transport system ATP-binding protein